MPVKIPSISSIPLSRTLVRRGQGQNVWRRHPARSFTATVRVEVVKPFLLADIGEGNHSSF